MDPVHISLVVGRHHWGFHSKYGIRCRTFVGWGCLLGNTHSFLRDLFKIIRGPYIWFVKIYLMAQLIRTGSLPSPTLANSLWVFEIKQSSLFCWWIVHQHSAWVLGGLCCSDRCAFMSGCVLCTEHGFKFPTHTCGFFPFPFSSVGLCVIYFEVLWLSAYTSGVLSHSRLVYLWKIILWCMS